MQELMACTDCLYYIAGAMDEHDREDEITARWEGYAIYPDSGYDDDEMFSWSPCECCGSDLGGARFKCVAVAG